MMRSLNLGFKNLALSLFALLLIFPSWPAHSQSSAQPSAQITIIAHPEVDHGAINISKLKSIFSMRYRQWPSGNTIKVYVLKDNNPTHILFTKKILQTYPYNLRRIWDRRVYSGTGTAPIVLNSPAEMLLAVANNKNSIGYLPESQINDRVKVLNLR